MTDLFIHIGAPKTGTTAIQHFLQENRGKLAQHGVLYPSGGALKAAHHVIGAAVFPGRSSRLGAISRDDALSTAVREIRKEIADCEPRVVILSTEYLWGDLSSSNIRRLLEPFQDMSIKVVAYLRRQDLLAQSLYVQAVKGGLAEPFHVWLERAIEGEKAGFDFHKVLRAWRDAGIAVDIVVRVYEKSQLRGDICSDFLATVCPGVIQAGALGQRVVNPGPDRTTVELMRLINARVKDDDLAGRIRKRVLAHSPSRPFFAPLNYLPAAEVAGFVNRFGRQNAAVARDFLGRADGVLFREPLPPEEIDGTPGIGATVILDRLVDLLPPLLAHEKAIQASRPASATQDRAAVRNRGGIVSL
jgi:hypothetical protein